MSGAVFSFDNVFNALPHGLDIQLPDRTFWNVGKQGDVLRLAQAPTNVVQTDPVKIVEPPVYTELELVSNGVCIPLSSIPVGSCVLVSALVGDYLQRKGVPAELAGRSFYSPDTGPVNAVRDSAGAIIGTRALVRWV